MPVYEYECEKCGHDFEREQRISDPPVKTCPACRSRRVRKLISRSSFVLKGGGWYADGYAGPRKSESASDASTAEGGSSSAESPTAAAAKTDSGSGTASGTDSATASKSGSETRPKAAPTGPASGKKSGRKKKQSAA